MSLLYYPLLLTKNDDDTYIAEFVDIPEAKTIVRWPDMSPLYDCLYVALTGYLEEGREIPKPSSPPKIVTFPVYIDSMIKDITDEFNRNSKC